MALSLDKEEFKTQFAKVHSVKVPEQKALKLVAPAAPKPLPLFPSLDASVRE
jgi:hypothetical protein